MDKECNDTLDDAEENLFPSRILARLFIINCN